MACPDTNIAAVCLLGSTTAPSIASLLALVHLPSELVNGTFAPDTRHRFGGDLWGQCRSWQFTGSEARCATSPDPSTESPRLGCSSFARLIPQPGHLRCRSWARSRRVSRWASRCLFLATRSRLALLRQSGWKFAFVPSGSGLPHPRQK